MPYIDEPNRHIVDLKVSELLSILQTSFTKDEVGGVLNYVMTRLLVGTFIPKHEDSRYKNLSKIIGTLECCKEEIYRRLGSDMEDSAIARNGDVKEFNHARWDCDKVPAMLTNEFIITKKAFAGTVNKLKPINDSDDEDDN